MTKTLFLIHGMWGGGFMWDNHRAFYENRGYRCVVPTLRYHDVDPASPPHPDFGTVSLRDYADDLEQEIRALEEPPVVIGHSMGGLLAQMLAARGLAPKVVCLTPAAPRGVVVLSPSVLWSFKSILTTWAFWRKPCRQTFKEAAYATMHLLPPEERRQLYDRLVDESGRAIFECGLWLFDSRRVAEVDPAKVTCPMLVVGCKLDRITPASVVRKVARRYKADYEEFPDHAHWVLGEPGWERVAGVVLDWIEAH